MFAFFVSCAVLGGVLLLAQLVLAGADFGAESELDPGGHDDGLGHAIGHGLDLFSARSITAGVAFFGVAGAGALRAGLGATLATGLGIAAGLAAMLAVAWIMSQLLRLEDDGTVRVERAVGAPATVYLAIPGARAGAGKVTLTLQGRTVEYEAVTAGAPLPTGSPVVVLDVVAPGTLEVAAHPEVGV
jgi:hypothetical protein